jgi:hypothetical protein
VTVEIDGRAPAGNAGRTEVHTIDEAVRVKTAAEAELLKRPGVTGIDVGQRPGGAAGQPVIRIYVADKSKAEAEANLPRDIQGVPVELVERRFTPH